METAFLSPAGTRQRLVVTAIPFIRTPTGTMSNNGAYVSGTALASIYPNAYCYFAAAQIAAGSAAGWYFAQFSSTTVGTIFNNVYTTGQPVIPVSPTAFVTTGPGAITGDTTSQAGLQYVLPGGLMGINGQLDILSEYSFINNANNKTITAFLGAGQILGSTQTANGSFRVGFSVGNQGVQNKQVVGANTGSTSVAQSYTTVDTSANQTITFNTQLAVATDYLIHDLARIEVIPG